jgi:peptide methionine sulfoxide reductase msrA/msrB
MKKTAIFAAALAAAAPALAGKGAAMEPKTEKATLAGGCFWCVQPPFDELKGVLKTVVGYTGGKTEDPTYEEVSGGDTGHLEAAEVTFDPAQVSYEQILEVFWRSIDPTDPGGQFYDRGDQYRTAVFYHSEAQKKAAEESRRRLEASGRFDKPIAVEIRPASAFYPAEEYHQKYYCKRPAHYNSYKKGSGREDYLKKMWKEGAPK